MDRREFLRTLAIATGSLLMPVGGGWALAAPGATPRRVVVVFLRGAVDGLSVVAPYGDPAWAPARPTIALPDPGQPEGLLALDRTFGLHPALRPLWPHWQAKRLAFVHASGDPRAGRSHFEAQDALESGLSGAYRADAGWLNRLAGVLAPSGPAAAMSVGETVPRSLAGPAGVVSVRPGKNAGQALPLDRPAIQAAFDRMYAGDDALARAYRQGRDGRKLLLGELAALDAEMVAADAGAQAAAGFAADADRLAKLIARRPEIRLAFMAVGGWDTHVDQGAARGQLARKLGALGQGLAALAAGLGPALDETLIVVMSEFGRTVAENGNGGTDHGHGNAIWLLGGPVAGGRVWGQWPGLAIGQRFDGRDLAITTDYRAVLAEVLHGHLGLADAQTRTVLPGGPGRAAWLAGLVRS